MVITMITHPHDRIARESDSRASGKKEFQPLRHFEAAMGKIAMQIKCCADSAPEKSDKHDRKIRKVETMEESDEPQNLQSDQNNKNEELELFVLKHAAKELTRQPTGRARCGTMR